MTGFEFPALGLKNWWGKFRGNFWRGNAHEVEPGRTRRGTTIAFRS